MDEFMKFCNVSGDSNRNTPLRGAFSSGPNTSIVKDEEERSERRHKVKCESTTRDTSYVEKIVKDEETLMMNIGKKASTTSRFSSSSYDDDDDGGEFLLSDKDLRIKNKILSTDDGVYSKYNFDTQPDTSLPVFDSREKILSLIDKNPVVILQGDTGCGKTTQIPQYILDNARNRKEYCKIVVTQPRRLAAISISHRVSQERGWNNGTVVGYQVGLHQELHEESRIVYCTTGLLLQNLINEKSLNKYTHIILDEVHERDQDMDFLLIVVRRLLAKESRHVKIILMSATINAQKFADYFRIGKNPAPVLQVSHRKMYSVSEYYLQDYERINPQNAADIVFEKPGISSEMYKLAVKLIIVINTIEEEYMKTVSDENYINASILIFLPGLHEINEMYREVIQSEKLKCLDLTNKIFPIRLHSLISTEEQQKVFDQPPKGYRKVILATNIAESSITVPDVKYVIDFCLTKALHTYSGFSKLCLKWASKANCRQRAGRAGRIMDGRVYRLMPKEVYEENLEEFETPEMLRAPLESVVLKSKILDMGTPIEIIGLAMDAPCINNIYSTILRLKELQALYTLNAEGEYRVDDGDLTFVGRVMANLPLDPRLARLILFGHIFSLLPETIIIAAGLSVRSIFEPNRDGPNRGVDAFYQKMRWSEGSGSDLIAILKAYQTWKEYCENLKISHTDKDQYGWARRYYLNLRSLKEMHLLVQDLTERLKNHGIEENTSMAFQHIKYLDHEKIIVLKVIIAGAFFPNFFTRSSKDDTDYVHNFSQALGEHDPLSTVYLRGFNSSHLGQLYTKSIKQLFSVLNIRPEDIQVDFLKGSERIYVTFKSEDTDEKWKVAPGMVMDEVHKAIRMRIERIPMSIRVMQPYDGYKYAEKHGLGKMVEGQWVPKTKNVVNTELFIVPSLFEKTLSGKIVHIETCSKFYMHPKKEVSSLRENESVLDKELRSGDYSFKSPSQVQIGMTAAAPFESRLYFRVKIIQPTKDRTGFRVKYIDYGNHDNIDFSRLRRIPSHLAEMKEMPPRCIECRLAKIQPSALSAGNSDWHPEAMELLQNIADSGTIDVEIYSVANLVASVVIKTEQGEFNEMLVEKNYAQYCDESFLSMQDHELRCRKQKAALCHAEKNIERQNEDYVRSMIINDYVEIDPPPSEICCQVMKLRGPHTPLETNVQSANRFGAKHSVAIEKDSINSVLLDHNPQSKNEQLLIAADVTANQNSDGITARSTTLGPNIHGFGALMTLLFARSVQLKTNKNGTKFVSLLGGLGLDEKTGKPLFEENDIVMNLDVDILLNDVELINQLRHLMEELLFTDVCERFVSMDNKSCVDRKAQIKTLIIKLLNKQRQYVERQTNCEDLVWEKYNPKELIGNDSVYGNRTIFPPHKVLELKNEEFGDIHTLREHCVKLYDTARLDISIQPTMCRLCNQTLEDIMQLRMHLISQLHNNREKQIGFDAMALERLNASQINMEFPSAFGIQKLPDENGDYNMDFL